MQTSYGFSPSLRTFELRSSLSPLIRFHYFAQAHAVLVLADLFPFLLWYSTTESLTIHSASFSRLASFGCLSTTQSNETKRDQVKGWTEGMLNWDINQHLNTVYFKRNVWKGWRCTHRVICNKQHTEAQVIQSILLCALLFLLEYCIGHCSARTTVQVNTQEYNLAGQQGHISARNNF